MHSEICIPDFGHGPSGFIRRHATLGSPPESLQRIEAYLSSSGFTTAIEEGNLVTLPRHQVVATTTTGWLLTWSRQTRSGLAVFGRLWVAGGVEPSGIPFTST